jgi:hypothetical protein
MRWIGTWIGPGSLSAILALAGCGVPFETGAGGGGGSGGQTTNAGTGGGTSSSTGTTTTSSGGCTPGNLATCDPGDFCNASSQCVSCTLATTFNFGTPQPIQVTPAPISALYPRLDKLSGPLYFVNEHNQIMQAQAGTPAGTWEAAIAMPAPFNPTATSVQEGPLPWIDGSSVKGVLDTSMVDATKPVLLFGTNGSGDQMLVAANLTGTAPPSPSPLKVPPLLSGDSSIAATFGLATARLYWIRNSALWTAMSNGAVAAPVNVPFSGGCAIDPTGAINQPWVRPDGTRLLFSAASFQGATCAVAGNAQSRLFSIELVVGTGQAMGAATQIFPTDTMDDDETPSLSPDTCTLYFSRAGVLMQAPRE